MNDEARRSGRLAEILDTSINDAYGFLADYGVYIDYDMEVSRPTSHHCEWCAA